MAPQLSDLPVALLALILQLLPLDERLRAAEVCRAWRDALAPQQLWARVDLDAGVCTRMRDEALHGALKAAARRAGGSGFRALSVAQGVEKVDSRSEQFPLELRPELLLSLLREHAGSLRFLWLQGDCSYDVVRDVLLAAPSLEELHMDFTVRWLPASAFPTFVEQMLVLRRREPPFPAVCVRRLFIDFGYTFYEGFGHPSSSQDWQTLVDILASLPALEHFSLRHFFALPEGVLQAFLDAASAAGARSFALLCCVLQASDVPAVCSLLRDAERVHRVSDFWLKLYGSGAAVHVATIARIAHAICDNALLRELRVSFGWIADPNDSSAYLLTVADAAPPLACAAIARHFSCFLSISHQAPRSLKVKASVRGCRAVGKACRALLAAPRCSSFQLIVCSRYTDEALALLRLVELSVDERGSWTIIGEWLPPMRGFMAAMARCFTP